MPSIWSNFSKPKIVTQPHKTHSKLNEKKNSPRCTMALATRDLLVLLVAAVISLASFHWEASFDFAVGPTMSLHTNSGKTEFTNMPEPIVLDHDFDGRKDVLMAFDRSIAIFRWSGLEGEFKELKRYQTPHQPLLMTYIGPKKSPSIAIKSQLQPRILLLTAENFNVTCLTFPDLTPIWSTRLPGMTRFTHEFPDLVLAEHAMVADYTALYKGDEGAVFLTIRFDSPFDVAQDQANADDQVNNLDIIEEKEVLENQRNNAGQKDKNTAKRQNPFDPDLSGLFDKQELRDLEYITRPSFFALDLTTGKIRWRNTARDEHSRLSLHEVDADAYGDDDQEEMSQTAHDYRRHLAEKSQHFEEGNWRNWKSDLIDYGLPHQWYTTRHTSLTPVRFSVTQDEANERRGRRNVPQFDIGDYEDPYRYMQHTYQHAASKSANNVLLYEHAQGITVIHLYTGRILTRLSLPPFRTYADANGDQTINSVIVNAETSSVHMSTLYEEERTLGQSQVFTSKLPNRAVSFAKLHKDSSDFDLEFAPPLLLAANTRFSNPGAGYTGALGQTLAQIIPDLDMHPVPEKAYYMIFMNSLGYIYCMRSDTGQVQWIVETDAGWAGLQALRTAIHGGFSNVMHATANVVKQSIQNDAQNGNEEDLSHANRKFGKQRKPKPDLEEDKTRLDKQLTALLMPFSIESAETHPTGVLAVTPSGLVLVGPDGSILARELTNLPTVSKTTLPIIADFTNDGRNDVIIATHRGYHFYVLVTGKSHVYPLLVASFLLCLLVIAALKFNEARNFIKSDVQPPRTTVEASNILKAE